MYFPTQNDINLMKQRQNTIAVTVRVLDRQFVPLGEVEGEVTSDNFTFDVDSDVRKSATITFVVKNNSINIGEDKKLWINRYIQIILKKKEIRTGNYIEYNRGIYVLQDYTPTYSATDYSISLKCADMVCLYNGNIAGALKGQITRILKSELDKNEDGVATIRNAMLKVMEWAGIVKYKIGAMNKEFPYERLEYSASQTWWDMVVELRDLYPGWEAFFDVDGTFVCQPIPTAKDDIVVLDSDFWKPIVIDESITCDLFSIKNATKVWGKCLECDRFSNSVTYDADTNTYTANFSALPIESDGTISTGTILAIEEISATNKENPKLKITNTVSDETTTVGTYNILNDSANGLAAEKITKNSTYVFKYRRRQIYLQGQWQIVAVCYLVASEPSDEIKKADAEREGTKNIYYTVNPDSPFCREYIDERMQVLSSGDCDKIYSDEKAIERAEYENWQSARQTYSLNLNSIFVPFIYGNEKVEYTLKSTGETKNWIIKSMSGSWMSGTMSLSLSEFYPLYPFIVKEDK